MLVHNILYIWHEHHGIPESSLSTSSGIKSQLITFAALITPSTTNQAQCFHIYYGPTINKLLSLNSFSFSPHKSSHVNYPDSAGFQNNFYPSALVKNQHQFCCRRIYLTHKATFSGQRLVTAHNEARNMMSFSLKPQINVSPVTR